MAPTDFSPFAELPQRTKNKIIIDGDEDRACWHWTGSFVEPKPREKAYRVPNEYAGGRNFYGCVEQKRGETRVSIPGKKGSYPAHRHVYACLTGLEYDEVPQLSRCANPRCVSPYHVHPKDLPPHAIRMRAAGLLEPAAASGEPYGVSDTLRRVRPASCVSTAIAEEECNLPAGSITDETWREYVAWDEITPDPDND